MNISDFFEEQILFINNRSLRQIVRETLNDSPECIVHIGASSSGKYHPSYSLGEGGLMRHVKAAVNMAHSLIQTQFFDYMCKDTDMSGLNICYTKIREMLADAVYAALILHDCEKPDETPQHRTRFDHPLRAAESFAKHAEDYLSRNVSDDNKKYLEAVVPIVKSCIASHMGEFNTSFRHESEALPIPRSGLEWLVHLTDYLGSRKYLIFDFDVWENCER